MPSLKTFSWIGWALVCALIVLGSLGEWTPNQPGVWAPMLISVADVAQNVLIYVAFGVFGVLSRLRADGASARQAQHRPWWREALKISLMAVLFSACNEALQLYTLDRVASVIDIASAGIGAFAGGAIISSWRVPK